MIEQFDFNSKQNIKAVIALGFFDCLHIGHRKIIETVKESALKFDATPAFFTFKNDAGKTLGFNRKCVFTYNERLIKAERLGIKAAISCDFDEKLKTTSALNFLNILKNNFNPIHIVCGFDYTFGKNAEGNVGTLKNFCDKNHIKLSVCDEQKYEDEKISTSGIRRLLSYGDIKKANLLLGDDYSLCGVVKKGRQVGRRLGFPTANVYFPEEKSPLKYGVYHTYAFLKDKRYEGITNYGNRPTFGLNDEVLTETFFDEFNGDLYGENIEIRFVDYIRPIEKFISENELADRLKKDLEIIRND